MQIAAFFRLFIQNNKLLIFTVVFILILSYLTFHGDLYFTSFFASKIAKGDFNIYGNLNSLNYNRATNLEVTIFPPLAQFIDGFVYSLFYYSGIYSFNLANFQNGILPPIVTFVLKIRYLIPYLLSVFIMERLALIYEKDRRLSLNILVLWVLCPVLIFTTFMQGNNDIYPTFFTILFLYYVLKGKNITALIFLGLAAAIKNFALLLLIPTVIILSEKDIKKIIFYLEISMIVYLLSLLPYYKYTHHILSSGGEAFFLLSGPLTGGIPMFPVLYPLVVLHLLFSKIPKDKVKRDKFLIKYLLLSLSSIYITSFFHPQWFVWVMPFLILTVYKKIKLFYIYLLINTFFFVSLFTNWPKNLDMYIFSNVFPIITQVRPFLPELVRRFPGGTILYPLVSLLFVATYIYFLFIVLKDKTGNQDPPKKENMYLSILPLFIYLFLNGEYVLLMLLKS